MERARLERSCKGWVRCGPSDSGIQRMQAWFAGAAFARHRHDTYAVGVTERGVQAFYYRGSVRASIPGEAVVLHPDEPHDGFAGRDGGFAYRIVYVDPVQVQEALYAVTGRPSALPFVPDPVVRDPRLVKTIRDAFDSELPAEDIVLRIAECLLRHAGGRGRAPKLDIAALARAKQLLDATTGRVVRVEELEAASGLPRFELARQFRAWLGTSPYRYSLMRRLALVRDGLGSRPVAELALEAGFADQAHCARMFKRAFGLTPGRYAALANSGSDPEFESGSEPEFSWR